MLRRAKKIVQNINKIRYTTKEEILQKLETNTITQTYTDYLLKFETQDGELNFLISNYLLNCLNQLKPNELELKKYIIGNKILSTLEKINSDEIPESKFIQASVAFILKNGEMMEKSYEFLKHVDMETLPNEQIFQIFILACHLGKFEDAKKFGEIIESKDKNYLNNLEIHIENYHDLINYPKIYQILRTNEFKNSEPNVDLKTEVYKFTDYHLRLVRSYEHVEENLPSEVTYHSEDWDILDTEDVPTIQRFGQVVTWLEVEIGIPLTGIYKNDNEIIFSGNGIRETKDLGEVFMDVKYDLKVIDGKVSGICKRRLLLTKTKEENLLEFEVEAKIENWNKLEGNLDQYL